MHVLPAAQSLQVLLAWSEAVEIRRGWVKLNATEVPGLAGMTPDEISTAVSELTGRGYCTPAAYGDLVYITGEGAKLARATREVLRQGVALSDLTLDTLRLRSIAVPAVRSSRSTAELAGIRTVRAVARG